jgi:hypothetical protein
MQTVEEISDMLDGKTLTLFVHVLQNNLEKKNQSSSTGKRKKFYKQC